MIAPYAFLTHITINNAIAENTTMEARPVDLSSIVYRPGKGLQITSEDGDFKMITRLRAQMRYTLENSDSDWAHGMQIRRARLLFQGNVFGEHNKYKFELAVSPKDIGLSSDGTISKSPLLDWYFHFDHLRDLNLRIGQYKVPYNRQRVVSSGNLQMVDRSSANGEFTMDRDVGMDIRSKKFLGSEKLRYYAGVYTGEGHSSFATGDLGMMYLTRAELLPFGSFKDYSEGSFRSSDPKISLGVAFAYLQDGKRDSGIIGDVPLDGGTTDTLNATADLCFRASTFSLEAAYFWREGTRNPGQILNQDNTPISVVDPRNGTGYYVQGGYFVTEQTVEVTGRYGEIIPAESETSMEFRGEAGVGLNYYFAQHAFKLQTDYFRIFDEGGLTESESEFRLQLQMAY